MKRQNATALIVIGVLLTLYVGSYVKVRSSSYWYGGDYYFGITSEELENGSDPYEDPARVNQLKLQGRIFWPCIQIDQIFTGDIILIQGHY